MTYADKNDLKNRLSSSVYNEIYSSDSLANEDLADAQAEIDGAVATRYDVPVTSPSEALALLKGWTLVLAEERAFLRTAGSTFPEKVKLRAKLIREQLNEIRTGSFLLPGVRERDSASIAFLSMDRPVFGRDTMKHF